MSKRWIVKQGTSRGTVRANSIQAARDRAALIGFRKPDSIVLETDQDADRYLAVMAWARSRYTQDGALTISVGGVPSRYTLLERAVWNRYMAAA